MKKTGLRERLKEVEDPRRGQGQVHRSYDVLTIAVMATMSGYLGYRAIVDFISVNKDELIEYFKPKRDKLPSFATVWRVITNTDAKKFSEIVEEWLKEQSEISKREHVAIDGKALSGTKQSEEDKKLAHMVTLFKSRTKEVIHSKKTESKSNEIPLVQQIILDSGLKDVIFTMDAMHCQSETIRNIKRSGNDCVVGVKDNQKKTA